MFIVIEGIDGSGKTTITNLLKNSLEDRGKKVWLTKEPTDSEIGRLIREFLHRGHKLSEEWGRIMALLFGADRYLHQIKIKEKLKEGYVVISDRYYHSTYAYQILYPNINIEWVKEIHKYLIKADYVFILDVPVEIAIERLNSRKRKHIYEKIEILKQVRENYLKLRDLLQDEKIFIIDNTKPPEITVKEIIKILNI